MISPGIPAPACNCRTHELWTADAGRHWHETRVVAGDGFAGRGGTLVVWRPKTLLRARRWPPGPRGLRLTRLASISAGTFVEATTVPGGVVALVSNRAGGAGWDTQPRLVLARGGVRTLMLPRADGLVLADSLRVAWPRIDVLGTDYADPVTAVRWTSPDGGVSWTVTREPGA